MVILWVSIFLYFVWHCILSGVCIVWHPVLCFHFPCVSLSLSWPSLLLLHVRNQTCWKPQPRTRALHAQMLSHSRREKSGNLSVEGLGTRLGSSLVPRRSCPPPQAKECLVSQTPRLLIINLVVTAYTVYFKFSFLFIKLTNSMKIYRTNVMATLWKD